MQYSCGYWEHGAKTLAEAQEAKLDLIARKLKLEPGMRVLDVGCGWGGLSKFLAERYKVSVTGITVSVEQAAYAREWLKHSDVSIEVADYRLFDARPFDRIVSVGMFEHVGYKNYRTYMTHMSRLLADDGIFLLHTIGRNEAAYTTDHWIDTYIFPNGVLPSPQQISSSMENIFVLEDWHNFGTHYDTTLMAWYENFKNAWPELKISDKYDERFYRMWEYYLLSCAGAFRARVINLWQLVLTKKGMRGGYESVR
jgi:cyclopropane-fatty-acyl-phospholipid synthase